ncbi:MAG TPA: hypothetical protein VNM36_10860 [Gemmatimonadaceae bacterium]|nr:hypothetical protein [Gemmatimonadaceae bacterium]
MSITFISPRIDVPVTRAWNATYMASPRMTVDTNHTGAGTRA